MSSSDNLNIQKELEAFFKSEEQTFLIDTHFDRALTRGEFLMASQNTAEIFKDIESERIALILPNSIELLVLYFGGLLAKKVLVPIDPLKGTQEIREVLEEAQFPQVISNSTIKEERKLENVELIENISEKLFKPNTSKSSNHIFEELNPNDLYTITFTSGTTGKPKGVMHSFENLAKAAKAFVSRNDFNNSDVFYHNLPMTYMAGILNLFFVPMFGGSKVVIAKRFTVSEVMSFWKPIVRHNANAFFLIPTIVSLLLRMDRGNEGISYTRNTDLKFCVGTAPLSNAQYDGFNEKYGQRLFESYGLSETLFVSANADSLGNSPGVGTPLDGVELKDEVDGELFIKTPWNCLGYFNFPETKVEAFFPSGDLGNLHNNGFLEITGRKKDIIIRGGVNLSPRKMVEFIQKLINKTEIEIIGAPDSILGEKIICCIIESDAISDDQKKEVRLRLMESFGRDYCIDGWFNCSEFPRNINGKIDKTELQNLYAS